jgi:hypothetical protein
LHTSFSEETRIYAGAASDFKGAVAGEEHFREFTPHRDTLRPADA